MKVESRNAKSESAGNGVLLVVIDGRHGEARHVPESVIAALVHLRIPYRIHDLGHEELTSAALRNCAAVLIAQEHLGSSLDGNRLSVLLEAVKEEGLGLVCFDPYLTAQDTAFAGALGFGREVISIEPDTGATSISVPDVSHFINYTQAGGAQHHFLMPLPTVDVGRVPADWDIVAETEGRPAVVAGRYGKGRVVTWAVSPRLWLNAFFGHAHGLDDIFWKGIVWVARKPFAMLPLLPFVRFRFDDCRGLYRSPEDLGFVGVLNEFGHKPNMCICMNALQPEGWAHLRNLHKSGDVEVAPHTWEPDVGLFYGDKGGEYSDERAKMLIQDTKAMLEKYGITPSKILSDHNHECSKSILPYLSDLGIEFKMNVMLPGETWTGEHVDWAPAPYGSMSYALDYIPGPYPLFVVFNHYPTFDFARTPVGEQKFLLNRSGGFGECKWDFLNGLTKSTLGQNDLNAMVERLVAHTRLGLNSGFFGGSITHSHFSSDLTVPEWRWVMTRYERLTQRFSKLNVGYDNIAVHARGRHHTFIDSIKIIERTGSVQIGMKGQTDVPLFLEIFTDVDEGVESTRLEVPPFVGECEVSHACA